MTAFICFPVLQRARGLPAGPRSERSALLIVAVLGDARHQACRSEVLSFGGRKEEEMVSRLQTDG